MENILEFRNVTKKYFLKKALDKLSFVVPKNTITAFVGPNGAGKTTTFSLVANALNYNNGEILIDGVDHIKFLKEKHIGFLPQNAKLHDFISVKEELELFSKLSLIPSKKRKEQIRYLINFFDLEDKYNEKISKLSFGMKVKIKVIQAFLEDSSLILLDEPTAGLDFESVVKIRELIKSYKEQSTVIISSHNLLELQDLCDYICFIDHGILKSQGLMKDFLGQNDEIVLRIEKDKFSLEDIRGVFCDFNFSLSDDNLIVTFDEEKLRKEDVMKKVMKYLLDKDILIKEIKSKKTLEDKFLEEINEK